MAGLEAVGNAAAAAVAAVARAPASIILGRLLA